MIDQVVAELEGIALDAADASGFFPALYLRVTREMAAGIRDQRFDNGPRMERFVVAFASFYLRAHAARGPTPRCWRATWDVARDPNLLIAQHLLLGINAHVNHDLPQAVIEVADHDGGLQGVRSDFDTVNDVLAAAYTQVIRDLDRVSRWSNAAATLGGGRVFNFSLRVGRSQAWAAAERLSPLGDRERQTYVSELDEMVSVLAYLITRPAFPVNLAVKVARRLEEHDPRVVTRALVGV